MWMLASPEQVRSLELKLIVVLQKMANFFFFCLIHWKVYATPNKSLFSIVKAKIKYSCYFKFRSESCNGLFVPL